MEILTQLEDKIKSAVTKINTLQNRIDELEKENAEYKTQLEAKVEYLESLFNAEDSIEANASAESDDNAGTESAGTSHYSNSY